LISKVLVDYPVLPVTVSDTDGSAFWLDIRSMTLVVVPSVQSEVDFWK